MRGLLVVGEGRRIRAGMVATVAGGPRLLTASGANAAALIATLARPGGRTGAALSGDRALAAGLAQLTGPAALVVRGADPVRAAALSLDGSARGLIASGLVLAAEPLLSGAAPGASACASASLFCARAGLGPAGREALALAARAYLGALLGSAAQEPDRLAQRAAAAAERVVVRSDGADARLLSSDREALWALRLQAVTAPPGSEGAADAQGPRSFCVRADAAAAWFGTPCPPAAPADPRASGETSALEALLDLGAADAVLQKLTPLDALHGGLAAALYAARLTVAGLLRASGPVTVSGRPHPAGAEVELRWPLR